MVTTSLEVKRAMVIVMTLPGVKGQGFDSPMVLNTAMCREENSHDSSVGRASDMISEGRGFGPHNWFILLGLSVRTVSSVGKSIRTQGVI